MASILNIWGGLDPMCRDPEKADRDALRSDCEAIGRDMEAAIQHFEQEYAEKLRKDQR